MPEVPTAEVVINELSKSQDPLISTVVTIIVGVIAILAAARPLMRLVKDYNATKIDNVKANAEVSLYAQLKFQIEANALSIDRLEKDRISALEREMKLENEILRLKDFEQQVIALRVQLMDRDQTIESRNAEIYTLTRTIFEMKDQIQALEVRFIREEAQRHYCVKCLGSIEDNNASSTDEGRMR